MIHTFKAIPIIARGKPYVNIKADHSDPGRIVKYAQNPYLKRTYSNGQNREPFEGEKYCLRIEII